MCRCVFREIRKPKADTEACSVSQSPAHPQPLFLLQPYFQVPFATPAVIICFSSTSKTDLFFSVSTSLGEHIPISFPTWLLSVQSSFHLGIGKHFSQHTCVLSATKMQQWEPFTSHWIFLLNADNIYLLSQSDVHILWDELRVRKLLKSSLISPCSALLA